MVLLLRQTGTNFDGKIVQVRTE